MTQSAARSFQAACSIISNLVGQRTYDFSAFQIVKEQNRQISVQCLKLPFAISKHYNQRTEFRNLISYFASLISINILLLLRIKFLYFVRNFVHKLGIGYVPKIEHC